MRRLTAFFRKHKASEEKIAEGVAVGLGVGLMRQALRYLGVALGAATASAAITLASQSSTYHPNFTLSSKGAALLTRHEGVRYHPYNDATTPPVCTVGVGHAFRPFHSCSAAEFRETYTPAQVSALLIHDASWAESAVRQKITYHITQAQFDALVDLVFNAGPGSLGWHERPYYISLTDLINTGQLSKVPATLLHTAITAGGRQLTGLVTRRGDEGILFSKGYYGVGIGYFRPSPPPKPAGYWCRHYKYRWSTCVKYTAS